MGDWDGHVIVEMPDDVAAMAFSIRAMNAGHVRGTKTTRLYTAQEMMATMKKAHQPKLWPMHPSNPQATDRRRRSERIVGWALAHRS